MLRLRQPAAADRGVCHHARSRHDRLGDHPRHRRRCDTTYFYDADGNEILRDTPAGKTLYLGDTDVNANTAGTTITSVTSYYRIGDAAVASRNDPGTLSWLADDDQHTAQIAVDQTTLTASIRTQDPFGNPRGTVPNWPNPRGFVGGVGEPDGLIHLGARMYDPAAGRFVSDDQITDTDNPQQLNGYAYANNSPVTQFDPTGLSCIKVDGIVCASELHTVAGRKKLAKTTKAQVKYQKALDKGARKVAKQLKAEAKARAIFKKFFGGAGHTATAMGAGSETIQPFPKLAK